ncbi:MAG TPA: glycosyltransferase [Gemmatimonadales bacterium]|jgi:glycosyltransferase involved in cell wall biosynthesis
MRVVWITHNYPRHRGDVAGAFLHPLAVAIRQRGVDLRVVAPSDAGRSGRDEMDGVPIHRVRYAAPRDERYAYRGTMADVVRSPQGWITFLRLRRALHDAAEQELGPDGVRLLHAHWWIPAGLASPTNVPLVLTSHGTDVRLLDRFSMVAPVARRVFRRAAVVTTVSRALAAIIDRRCGVMVADDAIQPMPVADLERPWSDGSGPVIVIGRLTMQKRVDLAIAGFAAARERGFGRQLRIVGDGPTRKALERQVQQLGLTGAVDFLGEVAPRAVPRLLATASCCLMPARGEGFGLAAAEALMQGVPVIACSDGGGLTDIVADPGAGRLVSPDVAAIAGALAALAADPGAAAAARRHGLHWRAQLSPDFVATRCLTWYERALHA